jgi:hypothetical protein
VSAARTSGRGRRIRASRSASGGVSPPVWPSSTRAPPRDLDPG